MQVGEARFTGFAWRPLGRKSPTIPTLDLRIEPGQRVLLAGASGSGKSTLLYALAGALGTTLTGETSGEVRAEGRIGLVLQNPADSIVAERIGRDVAFGPENAGYSRAEIWKLVDAAIAAVGLPYGRQHLTSALSGGEQQRLSLAGVLATSPDVLLLDEPTSMLDPRTAVDVRDAVLSVVEHRTMVIVEHRIEPWLEHVDRVIALQRGGTVAFDGTPGEFLASVPPAGLWFPGRPLPEPGELPGELVRPEPEGLSVRARELEVELTTHSLRGSYRHRALRQFSADVCAGDVTAFTGRSGAGKSTALLAMSGLVKRVSGELTPDLGRLKSPDLAACIGWVPQNPEVGFVATSVLDEVAVTSQRLGREIDRHALLAAVGIDHLSGAHPYRLSGGEQRRLAMAAALAHRPGFVVMDEPTVGQDPDTWSMVAGWISAAAKAGAAVAVSTHDDLLPRDVAIEIESGVVV